MAKAREKKAEEAGPSILPLPPPAIRHHERSLQVPVSQWRESGHVPPVVLITGLAGVGKRSIAYYLSQWLLCERAGLRPAPVEDDSQTGLFGEPLSATPSAPSSVHGPCGECIECQKALKGTWVNFNEIASDEGDGETGSLKIEQFRNLKATMGFGAYDGSYRITLIRDADRLTVQAANSLLKLLEEPPPGWVIFMTAGDPSLLLPTLVSRCQILRLKPFNSDELRELLELHGVPKARIAVASSLAQGSWGKALKLTEDEIWEKRQDLFRFLEKPGAEAGTLIDWAALDPANLRLLLDQLEQITAELITVSVAGTSISPSAFRLNTDGAKSLVSHSETVKRRQGSLEGAREFWMERAERLFRARQESLLPLNKKLLIQDILLPFL